MATVTHRSGVVSTSNNASVVSASFTPTAGDLLVVVAAFSGGSTGAVTTSANGITFTAGAGLPVAASARVGADFIAIWIANQLVGASPVAMTVTSAPGGASSGGGIFVCTVGGVTRAGVNAYRGSGTFDNQTLGTTPSVTLLPGAAVAGNPLIGCILNATSPATMTPPTGWTEPATTGDLGYSTPTTGIEYAFLAAGAAASTVTWGGTSASSYGVVVIEIDASATPAVAHRRSANYRR